MKRLHQAVDAFGSEKVSIEWKPFVIDPNTSLEGEAVEAYCRRRWGSSGWTRHLKAEGRKDGAQFQNWRIWPNTWKAHQLIQYCREKGISTDDVNQSLFEAEYEEGKNISEVETLVQIASTLGIEDLEALRSFLTADQGKAQVVFEIQTGRAKYGIKGVPFFVVRGQDPARRPYGFSGAHSSETLLELFREMADED